MAFWSKTNETTEKTTILKGASAEISLKLMISEEEHKMNDVYMQIGKLYATNCSRDCGERFPDLVAMLKESDVKIREYRQEIMLAKGISCCQICGAEVQADSAFCNFCGAPIPKIRSEHKATGIRCAGCGATIKEGNRFCTECGRPVAMEVITGSAEENFGKICPNCGCQLDEENLFCTECGTKL